MSTMKYRLLEAGTVLTAIVLIGGYAAGVSYAQHTHTMPPSSPRQIRPSQQTRVPQQATVTKPVKDDVSLSAIHSRQVPAVQEAVERAIQHLQTGHQQQALEELKQIKASLESLRLALGKHVSPQIVNDRCPIMGGKIDPETVPVALTRMHGKDKVAFCCDGCPAQWSRLTYAERTARLKQVALVPPEPPQGVEYQH